MRIPGQGLVDKGLDLVRGTSRQDPERGIRAQRRQRTRDIYYHQRMRTPNESAHIKSNIGWKILAGAAAVLTVICLWVAFSAVEWMIVLLGGRRGYTLADAMGWFHAWKILFALVAGVIIYFAIFLPANRLVKTQNMKYQDNNLGVHADDQHIMTPEEIIAYYQPFPDAGAHCHVRANGLVSHIMIEPTGLKHVDQTLFQDKDVLDEQGRIIAYKGEPIKDAQGHIRKKHVPIIDRAYSDKLWDASGLPRKASLRRRFDATRIPYSEEIPAREKVGKGKYATMADMINDDWTYPDYEHQRPGGAYLVDHRPVNTMMLAITRAGKGQTYIEPMIDAWSREIDKRNMVINDPKGELMFKFFVPLLKRGFDVASFNLMSPLKTDIYNPVWMAADAARRGDMQKCASYVSNIATVFFPVSQSGDDPMWPNAASNAFSRCCYGLIDYYLEEEAEMIEQARQDGRTLADISDDIDRMWGKVTLYNCYEFFVILAGKKLPNPLNELNARIKANEFDTDDPDQVAELEKLMNEAEAKAVFWDDQASLDMFTIYFNATNALYQNSIRTLVHDVDSSLRAMAGSDKTIASVYGITLTSMKFFTDPTISTLTSGRPSQTLDLAGLSFPRRIGVRFAVHFIQERGYVGMQCRWQGYKDRDFKESLGADFRHEDTIGRQGWAMMLFKGILKGERMYLKLEVYSPDTELVLDTFRFQFTKGYRRTYDGTRFQTDPIDHDRIAANGTLVEMVGDTDEHAAHLYRKGTRTFKDRTTVIEPNGMSTVDTVDQDCIVQTAIAYTEKPKAIFFITPPHLKMYAKLILILVKQLFDLSVETSYMAKESQKPLYTTSYMLDEFGNLESEGHGVADLSTMLSIGLGQDQQFTLILQTLQQLQNLYDKQEDIVRGNTANIVFLKSNDTNMLEQLSKSSGTTHRVYNQSQSFQEDNQNLTNIARVQSSVSTTRQAEQEQLLTINDFTYLPERNSIVMQAGMPPIWNHNETILPMSYALLGDTIVNPGHPYTMQTLPSLSTAAEFDVGHNQPNFFDMFHKRLSQALVATDALDRFKHNYGYTDDDMTRLDIDQASTEIMSIVRSMAAARQDQQFDVGTLDADDISDNDEFLEEAEAQAEALDDLSEPRFAEGEVSPDMLIQRIGDQDHAMRGLVNEITVAYTAARADLMRDRIHFSVRNGNLCSSKPDEDGNPVVYVQGRDTGDEYQDMARKGMHGDMDDPPGTEYTITDDFLIFLANEDTWTTLGMRGDFDRAMARVVRSKKNETILNSDEA